MHSEPQAILEYPSLENLTAECDPTSWKSPQLLDCLIEIEQMWQLSDTEEACAIFRSIAFPSWEVEHFKSGNSTSILIDLKAIIKRIIKDDFDTIILCHSHPGGSTKPSEADLRTTRKVAQICSVLNVNLFDHIIFGGKPPFSFRQASYL